MSHVEGWQVPIRLAAVDMTSLLVSKPGGRGPATPDELAMWEQVHSALSPTFVIDLDEMSQVVSDLAGEAVFGAVAVALTAYEVVRDHQGPEAADRLLLVLRSTGQ